MIDRVAILEAILFVSEEPIPTSELAEVIEASRGDVEKALQALGERLDEFGSGIELRQIAGGWRLYTRPDARPYLERFASSARSTRISKAALETLSVVAYKQPVSRAQVSEIRGVDSDAALRTLERRGLIDEIGRADGPGQAVLFGTTPLFMEKVGINSLDELPPLGDHIPPAEVVETLERPFRPESSSNDSRS